MKIDIWDKNKYSFESITGIDCCFYPHSSFGYCYRGNLYCGKTIIGDFATNDSVEIEKTFGFTGFWFG